MGQKIGIIVLKWLASNELAEKGIIMKKIIGLIVAVVVIWGALKIMGIGVSVSPSPDKEKAPGATGEYLSNDYKFWTYKDIIGFSLPKRASEIRHEKYLVTHMKASDIFRDNLSTHYVYCWVVASLEEEDFDMLVENYELEKTPNLLKSRTDILELYEDVSFANWDIDNKTIKNVYLNESSDYEEYTACTYKDGKVYIKKVITYIEYRDGSKRWHYEKVGRE